MQRVRGVGGIFIRSKGDRQALLDWYKTHLGIDYDAAWGGFVFDDDPKRPEGLTWSIFKSDTDYLGPRDNAMMVNYKVDDLDAMLKQLRDAGVEVDDKVEDMEFGRFGWAVDPEGNRIELWEAPEGGSGGDA